MRRTHRIEANGLTHFVADTAPDTDDPDNHPAAVLLHGFPDSHAVWDAVTPALVAAGFRVIAPDLRGFGETDMAARVEDYGIARGAAPDVIGVLDHLNIRRAHIAGHDFGAPVAWALAAHKPDRFITLAALSVGHMRAFLKAGLEQKLRSLYIVYHQFRGLAEATYRFNNWALLRSQWSKNADIEEAIKLLDRPDRLTAALNWYRSNMSFERMRNPPPPGSTGPELVKIPTVGLWSTGEKFLTERQMVESARYVKAPWAYHRIEGAAHWIPYDAPDALGRLLIEHWRAHPDEPTPA